MTKKIEITIAADTDVNAIMDIYNLGIASKTSTFDSTPKTHEEISAWLHTLSTHPVLVAKLDGKVIGFARLFGYRSRACYAGIAEFSIYLAEQTQGKGIGTHLLTQLLEMAPKYGFHKVLSRVFPFNKASLSLCQKQGFREVGVYHNHAKLDDQWQDVVIVEKLL